MIANWLTSTPKATGPYQVHLVTRATRELPPLLAWLRPVSPRELGARAPR